jgi:hypothetical protein
VLLVQAQQAAARQASPLAPTQQVGRIASLLDPALLGACQHSSQRQVLLGWQVAATSQHQQQWAGSALPPRSSSSSRLVLVAPALHGPCHKQHSNRQRQLQQA